MTIINTGADIPVVLTEDEMTEFELATSEVEYLLINAGNIFDLVQSGLSLGYFDPESGSLISMMDMVGRGFNVAAEKEGAAMTKLSGKMRDARKNTREMTCL